MQQKKSAKWVSGLRKLERYRVAYGFSIGSFFECTLKVLQIQLKELKELFVVLLKKRRHEPVPRSETACLKHLCVQEFSQCVKECCEEITYSEADALGWAVKDSSMLSETRQTQSIVTSKSFQKAVQQHVVPVERDAANSVEWILSDHPIFPSWLVHRMDFQAYYSDLKEVDGCPPTSIVVSILRQEMEERRECDIHALSKWLKHHKLLVHVRLSRLLEVCR